MRYLFKVALIIFIIGVTNSFAQSELKFANLKNFETISGEVIKDLKIGYRTIGKLNQNKSNAILWPTWFTGTTQQILDFGAVEKTLDAKGIYLILVDALGNGISSSPSNSVDFPSISIKDMVKSQHELVVQHLGIKKLKAVVGVSMGAMQTYEWLVSYPKFMKKAVTIVGTPKQSFYDNLNWSTQEKLLENVNNDKKQLEFAKKRVMDIFTMNLFSPTYLAKNIKIEDSEVFMKDMHSKMNNYKDYVAQLKAMINHNIYATSRSTEKNIKNRIEAEVLIIVNKQDHTVNPLSSMKLAEELNSKLIILDSNTGHMVNFMEPENIKKEIVDFLKNK